MIFLYIFVFLAVLWISILWAWIKLEKAVWLNMDNKCADFEPVSEEVEEPVLKEIRITPGMPIYVPENYDFYRYTKDGILTQKRKGCKNE